MFLKSWKLSRLAVLLPLVCLTSAFGQSSLESVVDSPQPVRYEPQAVTLTVELDENKLTSLRQTGSLRIAIPAEYRGKVDAVRLKRPFSFKSKLFQLNKAVDKVQGAVTVTVNRTLLDQLDYQPVIAKIYYDNFSEVVLVYELRKPGDPIGLLERENQPTRADSQKFYVRIDDKRGMYGWMTGLAQIKLQSAFGDVVLNSTDIAGIKFNANKSEGVAIRLKSGASVSGLVDFKKIKMKCSWGSEVLSLAEIDSVVLDRKFRFATDPLHPGRWSFERDLGVPAYNVQEFGDVPLEILPYSP